ncbi:MAG: FGGY-family carbohydrate kinase [Prochlorothrix sp.]
MTAAKGRSTSLGQEHTSIEGSGVPSGAAAPASVWLGIDFGTSGARAVLIGADRCIRWSQHLTFAPGQNHYKTWKTSLDRLLAAIPTEFTPHLQAIALNGTSSTVLLCNDWGEPVTEALLYHDDRGKAVLDQVATIAPPGHRVHSSTSTLAKLLWWQQQPDWSRWTAASPVYLLHQADWLAFLLHGQLGVSDYHNALKLGYDVESLAYPDWLGQNPNLAPLLPQVVPPGTPVGRIRSTLAHTYGLNPHTRICAGTTDSIAAFLASGARSPGQGVTSLGSTLVIKLLSRQPVEDNRWGIYSHRLGDLWLVGGASNTGGAVLRQFFSPEDLRRLSACIDPSLPSSLHYYPLPQPGERFPLNDPQLQPRLDPRPQDDVAFLQGLLEGMARIEALGYDLLADRGTDRLTQVYTAGGGAENEVWMAMRERLLGVPVIRSPHTEAAYGTALLAQQGPMEGGDG